MQRFGALLALTVAALLLAAGPAWADEITDQLERGLKLYKQGKVSEALKEIDFATAQMRQKKAEGLTAIFPPAPSGWKIESDDTQAMGQALMGGGVAATRVYAQQKGDGRLTLEVLGDSPLIQGLGMLLANPMFQGDKNTKFIRVGDQRAMLVQNDPQSAEVQFLVDNKVLVKAEVREVAGAADLAKDMAGKVDLKKLRELSR